MMLESVIASNTAAMGPVTLMICTIVSLLCGLWIGFVYMYRNVYHKGFVITVVLMPAIVQVVIMMVNGNLGTGVAVVGAFSLVRFRSVAGGAREISTIFLSMAIGLATGMGYLVFAAIIAIIIGGASILLYRSDFASPKLLEKELKITIPETLDYEGVFDDIFQHYTTKQELLKVKTTNMGSMYELHYHIHLRKDIVEKEMIDELRCRNGNLNIICGRLPVNKEEL